MENKSVIEVEGNIENIVCQLKQSPGIEEQDGKKIIDFLETHTYILSDEETFIKRRKLNDGVGYALPGGEYYINIKMTTLILIIFLLDYNLTGGIFSVVAGMGGIGGRTIYKIKEENGERCILKELILQKKRRGDKKILRKFKGECCNNNLKCDYCKEGRCSCKEVDVENILKSFENKNIVKRKGMKFQVQI